MNNITLDGHSLNFSHFLKPLLFALLFCCAASVADAQTQDADKAVWVQGGLVSYNLIRQGSEFRVAVVFNVHYDSRSSAYINSHQTLDPLLVPAKLELTNLESLKGLTFSPFLYPKGGKKRFKFSDRPLMVYGGGIKQIKFNGFAAPDMPVGQYELKAKLTFQACDDYGCGTPLTKEIKIPLEIVDPQTEVRRNKYMYGPSAKDFALIPVRIPRGVIGILGCLVKGCS